MRPRDGSDPRDLSYPRTVDAGVFGQQDRLT